MMFHIVSFPPLRVWNEAVWSQVLRVASDHLDLRINAIRTAPGTNELVQHCGIPPLDHWQDLCFKIPPATPQHQIEDWWWKCTLSVQPLSSSVFRTGFSTSLQRSCSWISGRPDSSTLDHSKYTVATPHHQQTSIILDLYCRNVGNLRAWKALL